MKIGVVKNLHIGAYCCPSKINTYRALFREFRDVFSWTYKEMLGIDPNIVVHEIKMYLDAKVVQQCIRLVHPKKATGIKAEFKKLL